MITIGLTGNLGTGKSTVARMFAKYGAKIIDADAIVHELFRSDAKIKKEIVRLFGEKVLIDGVIDRRVLGQIVFNNAKKLKQLTAVIHPAALKEVQVKIKIFKKDPNVRMVVIDAPLLIEAGWHTGVDYLIVVKSSRQLQEVRLQKERGMSKAEIRRRLKFQIPIRQKINMADIVIDNRFSLTKTQEQTRVIVQRLLDRMKSP